MVRGVEVFLEGELTAIGTLDVTCVEDLDAVAATYRAAHGFRLRIATKYHNLERGFRREKIRPGFPVPKTD